MFVNNFFLFVTVNFSLYVIKSDTIDAIIKIEDDNGTVLKENQPVIEKIEMID